MRHDRRGLERRQGGDRRLRPQDYLSRRARPIRGLLFAFTSNPYGVVAIQLLDGVAAGIFGVIAILIASDLMRGTGRFNLAQGLVALCVGIGAGLSNLQLRLRRSIFRLPDRISVSGRYRSRG